MMIASDLSSDGVLLLKLDRKPVNAFSPALFHQLKQVIDDASDNPQVKCIVLASSFSKYFTAGLDLKDTGFPKGIGDGARESLAFKTLITRTQECVSCLEKCRVPVIAALCGLVYGAGVDIATACDIRLAAEDTTFSVKEVDIGIAADVGTLQRLPKVCGNDSKVRELIYTARTFDAQEAYSIGLLSQVVPGGHDAVIREAVKIAKNIASKSPIAIVGSKHLLNYSRDHTVEDGLLYNQIWNAAMIQGHDLAEATKSFFKKETPVFKPLAKL